MIRKLFLDFVIVMALCSIVWGSAPVWAGCLPCKDTINGGCTVIKADNGKVECSHYGDCGVTWWWDGTIYTCYCNFKTVARIACWCRTMT